MKRFLLLTLSAFESFPEPYYGKSLLNKLLKRETLTKYTATGDIRSVTTQDYYYDKRDDKGRITELQEQDNIQAVPVIKLSTKINPSWPKVLTDSCAM